MSISCPNPRHPDFIALVEKLGEKEAYRQFMLNANDIPNPDLYENVKGKNNVIDIETVKTRNVFSAAAELEGKLRSINKTANAIGSEKNIEDTLKKAGVEPELRKQFITLLKENPQLKSLKISEVLTNYLKEFVKDSDRQYYKAIGEPLDRELENTLISYFDKFKIRREEIDNLKEKFGVDTAGVFDVLAKTVYYSKNRNLFTLSEEYGHVFVELLGSISNKKADNPLFKYLFDNIETWDGYKRVYNEYRNKYLTAEGNIDIYKIRKEAIGQAIGIGLVRNYKIQKGDDSFWSKIQEIIDYVFNLLTSVDFININNTIDNIAKDILNKNYSKLDRLKKDTSNYNLLSYSETIKNQNKIDGGKALNFMQWFSKKGMLITGSLAYRLQGSTYRPEIDALHDIDNIVPSDVHKISLDKRNYLTEEQLEQDRLYRKYITEGNYKEAKKYKIQGNLKLDIDNIVNEIAVLQEFKKEFPDTDFLYTFFNQKANAYYITINAIWSENKELRDRFKSYTGSFNQRLENFTKEELEQIYLFDFFLRPESTEDYKKIEDKEYGLSLAHFNYAFYEKLNMMGRPKDAYDYQMWDYFDESNILPPDLNDRLVYFQNKKNQESGVAVEQDDDIPLSDEQLYEHANKFFGKLNVPFQLMSEEELAIWNSMNPDKAIGENTKGFFDPATNKVYLIKGRAGFYTALHEFTHPLVEWVYRNNNALFKTLISKLKAEKGEQSFLDYLSQNGYSYLLQDGKMTDAAWKEVLTTEIERESKNILNNANVKPGSFLEAVKLFWKKIKEAISNLVSKNIGKLNDKQILNLTINDLAIFMLDGDIKLDLDAPFMQSIDDVVNEARGIIFFKNGTTSFQSAVSAQVAAYKARTGKDITKSQLDVLNILLPYQALQRGDDGYVDNINNVDFKRTTKYIETLPGPDGQPDYFAYHGDDDDIVGLEAAEWGNHVDELATFIIEGLDEDSAIEQIISNHTARTAGTRLEDSIVSEKILRELYPKLKNFINNKYKDYVIIPQVILADKNKKVAGTVDILLISPKGKLKIVDVKTGKRSTEGVGFTTTYPAVNPENSSKKQKYTAQLSVYKALAKSMGLVFESSDELSLLPVFFPNVSESEITEARLEPVVPISAFEYVMDGFKTGSYTPVDDSKDDDPEVVLLKRVKIILTKRLSELNKLPPGIKKDQAIAETTEILSTINNAEPIKRLTEFINGLHKQFTNQVKQSKAGKQYTMFGLPSQIKYLTLQLASGEMTKEEALSKFLYIKKINDLYAPILKSVRSIINSKENSELKSIAKDKLVEIEDGAIFITDTYEKETIDIMADIISGSVSQKANEKAKELLAFKKERIDKETDPKRKEKLQKEYDQNLINLKSPEGITRDVIKKALLEGSSADINWVDLWFTPAVTSSSEIVAPFALLLKDKLEDARQELIKFERDAGQAFEEFSKTAGSKDNPANFNRGLYEEIEFFDSFDEEGKPVFKKKMVFVSPIDINKFQRVKAEFQRQLNSADSKDKRAIYSRYYGENFVRKSEEDVVIINPITKKPVVIEEGINTLIDKKRLQFEKGVVSESELESYISDAAGYVENGVTKYKAEFLTINPVKFKNPAYDAIIGSQKKYYDFLVSSYFKSQTRLPHKMGYVLPSIHKSGFDAVAQGGLVKYLKYEWSQLKDFKAEDINKYGEEGKNIPLIFNFDMDAQDVSLDLIQSIVMYEAESLEYQAKSRMADTGEVLLSLVEKTAPYETDTLGNKKLDAFAEKAGIKDEFLKYKKLFKGNNVASLLAFYMDSQIYGKMNVKTVGSDTKILGMNLEKLVDGVMGFASMTQVGGNPIGAVVNYLQAAMQANIEAAAKKHMSVQSWLKSRGIYDSHIMDYIGDFNSPYSKSLIGQLIDLYDPMQGEYKDSAGRRISKSMFKKMWSTNTWFFLQHQGEHSIQIRTMIAMMLDTKAINKDGKYINLYDAYEKGSDGKIKLKEGVKLQGKLSDNGLISREFQSTLHAVNKELQGVYNKQDKPMIESYWWGRLIQMYKKFLAPGLKRRYKALGYNQEMGDVTEGYLKTFYKKLMIDAGQLTRFMIGIDNGYFETHEKENLRRARREMLIVATTGLIVILLSALLDNTDDDDEKLRIKFLLYAALRINSDLGIYGTPGDPGNFGMPSPSEMWRTFKNPVAAYSVLDRLQKLLNQLQHPTEVYEVKSGIWEKGDSKLWADWLKFWGLNGANFDPSNSIKFIQMSTK